MATAEEVEEKPKDNLKEFSTEEIAKHTEEGDLWTIVGNRVLDVSKFDDHPGGPDVLEGVGGQDASEEFEQIAHSTAAKKQTEDFLIGKVEGTEIIGWDSAGSENDESTIIYTVLAIVLAVAAYYFLG